MHSGDWNAGMRHGGTLRVVKIARSLVKQGHRVIIATFNRDKSQAGPAHDFLSALKSFGEISDFLISDYTFPDSVARAAYWLGLGHPTVLNFALRRYQRPVIDEVREYVERQQIDVLVTGDTRTLFLTSTPGLKIPKIVDWIDSQVLYFKRGFEFHYRGREWSKLPRDLQYLISATLEERYYGRHSERSVLVSPIDEACLRDVIGWKDRTAVILNGVDPVALSSAPAKIPGRLLFSGNMDFPPNFESAIWFIDNVLPRIVERAPHASFVVAGANPVQELQRRAGKHVEVLGFVDSMPAEILKSELYVAPLVSGGGFKNKVVEALSAGIYVACTSMAVEFLDPSIRSQLKIADSAEGLAQAILDVLSDRDRYTLAAQRLRQRIQTDFTWDKRAEEFLQLARSIHAQSATAL